MYSTASNQNRVFSSPYVYLDHIILSKLVGKETSESDYEVNPFDKREIEAILNVAEDQVKNFFKFAFFTGLRTSGLIAIEWGDIDWGNGQAYINRAYVSGEIKKTKTKAGKRQVLLLPPALETRPKTLYLYGGHTHLSCPLSLTNLGLHPFKFAMPVGFLYYVVPCALS